MYTSDTKCKQCRVSDRYEAEVEATVCNDMHSQYIVNTGMNMLLSSHARVHCSKDCTRGLQMGLPSRIGKSEELRGPSSNMVNSVVAAQ